MGITKPWPPNTTNVHISAIHQTFTHFWSDAYPVMRNEKEKTVEGGGGENRQISLAVNNRLCERSNVTSIEYNIWTDFTNVAQVFLNISQFP